MKLALIAIALGLGVCILWFRMFAQRERVPMRAPTDQPFRWVEPEFADPWGEM